MPPAHIVLPMDGEVVAAGCSGLRLSIVGLITPVSIRHADYFGLLNKSTAIRSPGQTCWSSLEMLHMNRWASRHLVSASGEKIAGSRIKSSGDLRMRGLGTSVTMRAVK